MKAKFLVIGSLLLVAIAACHPAKAPEPDADEHNPSMEEAASTAMPSPELAVIDSLTWAQPDSAWVRLLAYLDDTCRGADSDRHFAHVLLAELLYKNDCAQTNREELQQAVDYYDSLTAGTGWADTRGVSQQDIFLAARAHYINGVGCYERDCIMQACQEYILALEIMEEYFDEKDLIGKKARFMALTYTHLASLFSDQYLHEQAIYFGKEALAYYEKYDATPWHKAWMLCIIGAHYNMVNALDSAESYYLKAASILDDTTLLMYRDVSTHLAYLSYKKDKDVQGSVNHLHRLLMDAESEKEYLARCLTIGEVFYHEKQLDSAHVYLSQVFHLSQNVETKKQAAEWLVEICEQQGRNGEIQDYARFLVPFANQNENQGHLKSQLANTLHDYERERLEIAHKKQLRKLSKYAGVALALLATLAAVFVAFHFAHKKRHKHLQSQKEAVEKQLETERYAHEIQKKALAGKLKKSNESLRSHLEEKENLRKAMETQQKQADWSNLDSFMDEDICKEIMDALQDKNIKRDAKNNDYLELKLSTVQLSRLSVAVEKHFHGFTKMLTDLFPRISGDEINQCQLYLLNLEDVKIAHLLSCDYSTVKKRSRKLKDAFHTEKTLRQFVRELVL